MLFLVVGPPAAGKSTWVGQRCGDGDIVVDWDALASVLSPGCGRVLPRHVADVVRAARRAAIDAAVEWRDRVDVYVIHALPSQKMLGFYRRMGARVVVVDPGEKVVVERCRRERPWQMEQAVKDWYRNPVAADSGVGGGVMSW